MIETERLLLRPYDVEDFGDYWSMLCEPAAQFASRAIISPEEAWQKLMAAAGHWSMFGYGIFALIEKSSGDYVGEAGLVDMRRGLSDRFAGCDEAGWYLRAQSRDCGLGYEAALAAHIWYERNFCGRSTYCVVDSENKPSISLALKLGYEVCDLRSSGPHQLLIFERTARTARERTHYLAKPSRLSLH